MKARYLLAAAAAAVLFAGSASAQTGFQYPMTPWQSYAPAEIQCGQLYGANFNITTDQAIQVIAPSANWMFTRMIISNPSVSMTTAQGGLYSGAGKTGVALVGATQAYTSLTTNSANTTGNALQATIVTADNTTMFSNQTQGSNAQTSVYFSLTTPQGAAATADIRLYCRPLY